MEASYRRVAISIFVVSLLLSNSSFAMKLGISSYFMYLACASIIIPIYYSFARKYDSKYFISNLILTALLLILFCLGLSLQDLVIPQKISLMLSMFVMVTICVPADMYFCFPDDLAVVAKSIIIGILLCTILAVASGASLTTLAAEGVGSSTGFNGGLQHKNYFSADICIAFICLNILYQFKKDTKNILLQAIVLILIVASNVRAILLLLLLYLFIRSLYYIRAISVAAQGLIIIVLGVTGCLIGVYLFDSIALSSGSYQYRINGLMNYINYYRGDWYHLVFGNAEMAFRETGLGYTGNIRSVVGWDGTTELSFLSILVKNGLLGAIGYVIIGVRYLIYSIKENDGFRRNIYFALCGVGLGSMFVENYMVNMNVAFGPCLYLILSGLIHRTQVKA